MTTQIYESSKPEDVRDILDARFARWGLHALSDADIWALAMATMVMPDGSPGPEGYLSQVTGTDLFIERLKLWGSVVAIGIAGAKYKAKGGARHRPYVEGYDESWGRYAVADGITLALYGKAEDAIGRSKDQGYRRIRDFVGGALLEAIEEYRVALEWAIGARRDRMLAGRWEALTGLNYGDSVARANIQWGRGNYYPLFAPGCAKVGGPFDSDQRLTGKPGEPPKADPETLYHGLRPTDWWSVGQERWTRLHCPALTIYSDDEAL